jgi:protocatechuate 3,4-dioxygenase beta subunit
VGYVPQALCWNLRDHPLSLPGEINLKFEKGISIGGTVQDDSDKPVSGATVEIYAPALVDGTEGVSTVEKPRTDREGKWRCDVVPKNITRCSIVVQHPDYLNAQSVVTEDMKQFKHVLRLGRGGNVTGQVLDQKDKPVEGARISYPLYAGDMLEPKAKTDAEGRFELKKCRLGPTSIFVSAKGFAPQYQAIDIGKETKPLEFRLEPGNTIRGRVVDLHGNPIAKTKVYAESWHKFRVFDSVVADQDGRFVWNSAPSDEVVLDFNPPGNWTRINQPLTASEQEQTITLYPELDIRGTVTDEASGKPIDQFQIIVSIDWERDGGMIKDKRIPGQKGLYEYKSKFSYPATYIGIEAEGYKPALSRKFLPIEGKQQYDFKLKKIK